MNYIVFLILFLSTFSFGLNNPFIKISNPPTGQLRVIEPYKKGLSKKNIVFLPAYFKKSLPSELYNSFLYNLASESTVYIPDEDNQKCNILINSLIKKKDPLLIVSHSSGLIKALEICNDNKDVTSLALLDPIEFENNSILKRSKINDKIKLHHIENLVIINSKKSSKWKIFPTIPPINSLKVTPSRFKINDNSEVKVLETNFGHLDILDTTWSDLSHKTFSKGSHDRNPLLLQKYHFELSKMLLNIADNQNFHFRNFIDLLNKNKLEVKKDEVIMDNLIDNINNSTKNEEKTINDLKNTEDDDELWLDIICD